MTTVMTVEERESQKHGKDVVHWMKNMVHAFTEILGYIAEGQSIEEKEEELRTYYKLMKLHESLT